MKLWIKSAIALAAATAVGGAATPAHAADITLTPVAGRYNESADKYVGGGNDVKAKRNSDGTYTLAKLAPTSTNAYAALIVEGVEGQELAELGTFSFTVDGPLGGGSPRMNLYYDNDGDGDVDGYALVGGAGAAVGGTISVVLSGVDGFNGTPKPTTDATLVSLSILVDEHSSVVISDVTLV